MQRTLLASFALTVALATGSSAQTPTWKPEFLGAPPPTWSTVYTTAVNDAGVVVGNTYLSGWRRAWIASPSLELALLPLPLGATWSEVHDVNSAGVAVGQILLEDGSSRAAVWQPGSTGYDFLLLPTGPGGFVPFSATGINDRGDVVGKLGIFGASYYWNQAEGVVQITYAQFPKVPGT